MFTDDHGNIGQMSAPQRSTGRRSAPRRSGTTAGATPPTPVRLAVPARVKPSISVAPLPALPTSTALVPAGPGGSHPVEIAGLLHELSARLLGADDMAHALNRLVAFGARALPGTLRCSVALIGEGGPPALAGSGPQAQSLDDLQYTTGEGPSLEAARTRAVVTAHDLPNDPRWPELAACARAEGVRGMAAIPLDVKRTAVGSVSFFVERPGGVDPEHLLTAMAIVNQAEVLLAELQRRESRHEGAKVDRAAGVIIAQRGCGVQEAYDVLRDTSQRLGLPREEVAERLIAAAARNAGS